MQGLQDEAAFLQRLLATPAPAPLPPSPES
jgi:hypothetical protein